MFRPGSTAMCECEASETDEAHCAKMHIHDENGARVATFHGAQYSATEEQFPPGSGLSGLCVYRLPGGAADAEQ